MRRLHVAQIIRACGRIRHSPFGFRHLSPPLTLQLSNQGPRTLRMAKIGVKTEKCRVSPQDQAVFRAVRPGETVKATFIIEPATADDLASVRADMTYIAGRAPMRLRMRAY